MKKQPRKETKQTQHIFLYSFFYIYKSFFQYIYKSKFYFVFLSFKPKLKENKFSQLFQEFSHYNLNLLKKIKKTSEWKQLKIL